MSWLQSHALSVVLPLILGPAASFLYQKIKKASDWIDARDPQTHAILTGAIAVILPYLAKLIPGVPAVNDLGGIDPTVVQTILGWIAMQLTHKQISK